MQGGHCGTYAMTLDRSCRGEAAAIGDSCHIAIPAFKAAFSLLCFCSAGQRYSMSLICMSPSSCYQYTFLCLYAIRRRSISTTCKKKKTTQAKQNQKHVQVTCRNLYISKMYFGNFLY